MRSESRDVVVKNFKTGILLLKLQKILIDKNKFYRGVFGTQWNSKNLE
jgi:hypothetical protein